jgi:hypothetical protein
MINMLAQSTESPRLKKAKSFMLASLIAGAMALPAMADDEVQFKGKEVGAFISDVLPFAFPFAYDGVTAVGEATHIGHYTLNGSVVANVIFGTATGPFTMTAANGDILFLDAAGYVLPTDPTKVVWNFTVTGGTGRFEGATGSITAQVQLAAAVGSISPNPYVARLEGTISTQDEDSGKGDQEDDRGRHDHSGRQ